VEKWKLRGIVDGPLELLGAEGGDGILMFVSPNPGSLETARAMATDERLWRTNDDPSSGRILWVQTVAGLAKPSVEATSLGDGCARVVVGNGAVLRARSGDTGCGSRPRLGIGVIVENIKAV
jgi:hypothetical protein